MAAGREHLNTAIVVKSLLHHLATKLYFKLGNVSLLSMLRKNKKSIITQALMKRDVQLNLLHKEVPQINSLRLQVTAALH